MAPDLPGEDYPWSAGRERSRYRPPAGAVDAHIHLYAGRYPADPAATLRPGDATIEDYRRIQSRLGLARCVVVQPSTYGTDNRCLIDCLTRLGDQARGIAVVDGDCSDVELMRLHAAGVRGLRFNLIQGAGASTSDVVSLGERIAGLGWHVQVQASAARWPEIAPLLRSLSVPVVIDHMGRLPQPEGIAHPCWRVLLGLVNTGRVWVKLSGAYLESRSGPPDYEDVGTVARAWAAHAPERLVFGTDWPHPSASATGGPLPDDANLLDLVAGWVGSETSMARVMLQNPCELYGFPP
jgi:D-galactarolactone isomerase